MTLHPTADLPTPDSRPHLIIFDLGGVVVRICRSWTEGCAAAGIPVRHDDRFAHPDAVARRKALHRLHEVGELPCARYYQEISQAIGGLYAADEVRAIHCSWILGEYDGVPGLLARLSSLPGLRTACLSNTNAAHWAQMTGLLAPLHHRFASHLLSLAKPDERIYRAVERDTGVPPQSILFFDDLPENIEAARRCGWRTCLIDHTAETLPQIRNHLAAHGIRA